MSRHFIYIYIYILYVDQRKLRPGKNCKKIDKRETPREKQSIALKQDHIITKSRNILNQQQKVDC